MNETTGTCPTQEVWHDFLDERGGTGLAQGRAELERHLESCTECLQVVTEVRRFRTLMLRGRVPGLDASQWRALDDRIQMMGSEFVPPQSRLGPMVWSLAAAAAFTFMALGVWQMWNPRDGDPPQSVAAATGAEASASNGLRAGAVEGQLEISDAAGGWQHLTAATWLRAGARLRAGGKGPARVAVPGHFDLALAGGTELEVESAGAAATFLRLRHGEVACQVDKRRPGQRFAVMAGRFRAEVVGTRFVVMHGQGGAVEVQVSEGAVRVDQAEHPRSAISETTAVVRAGSRWRSVGGRMELGPMSLAADAIEVQAVEAQPAPQAERVPTANARKDDAVVSAPALPRRHATEPQEGRKIIIHIPPQRMPTEEVERLQAMERLLWGSSAAGAGTGAAGARPTAPTGERASAAPTGARSSPQEEAAREPPPPPVAGALPTQTQDGQPDNESDAVPPPPPIGQ